MDNTISKQFIAVRAVIVKEGRFLLIREAMKYEGGANKGKYDFPGGKIAVGESIAAAIQREVEEETGLAVEVGVPFYVDEWRPVVRNEQVQIIGIFFICKPLSMDIKLGADHDEYKWVTTAEARKLPLIDATASAIDSLAPGLIGS